ncbi:hypothetical protein LTR62_002927 [Meristemomyces frigidus]|uniref:SH3 domain-containing protein n=1 Tax=Meristemomyces frigidus TaxID=1508187 RepID=A0AAN7TXW9_9PEZI|nr:hypothetical protein LTR62_002927 [Meristemomyces frigidus]
MVDSAQRGGDGGFDMEKELTCSAYLNAHPDRAKSDAEKAEMRLEYKPGDDVIPKVEPRQDETDSEEERMITQARELSMAGVDPVSARRRAERATRSGREDRERRRHDEGGRRHLDSSSRLQQPRQAELSEAHLRQHTGNEPQIEHQPSLRSLLSASPIESLDVQQEILQSITAEGLLDGLDLDNLTPEQEDQLTERIAEAYRRRQRRRDRSSPRDHREQRENVTPSLTAAGAGARDRHHVRSGSASEQQSRLRPPIARPHMFEHDRQHPDSRHQRSNSATTQHSSRAATLNEPVPSQAARSATDLTEQTRTDETRQERQRALSNATRSTTDPVEHRAQVHRMRTSTARARDTEDGMRPRALEVVRQQGRPTNNSSLSSAATGVSLATQEGGQFIRPAQSNAAFAPELVASTPVTASVPPVKCNGCNATNIQHDLHYQCSKCQDGTFVLCLACYREEKGCDHWFGFGFKAEQRWHASAPAGRRSYGDEPPHVLQPRRYNRAVGNTTSTDHNVSQPEEGAFCETCHTPANECYWYCPDCLEGAWGYCDRCVQQGKHCTHPLLPVAHISTMHRPFADPTRATFVPMPHLRPDSYVLWPVATHCDICQNKVPAHKTHFHCFECSKGNYDICTDCYYNLVATGKISQTNGPNGWRRCLQGHRMAVIGFQNVMSGGQLRTMVSAPVGGWRHKDTSTTQARQPLALDAATGNRCLAAYNYFPRNEGNDDLVFPKNAEISEVYEDHPEWFSGIYCGKLGLFPSSHVRRA